MTVTLQLARDLIARHPHAADLVHDIISERRKHGLTRSQRDVLDFIKAYLDQHGIPPTFQDIADSVGLRSKGGIHRVLTALEERGHIERLPARARAIRLK
jgi:repressor LexA